MASIRAIISPSRRGCDLGVEFDFVLLVAHERMPVIWRIPDRYPERAIGEYDRTCSPDRFLFLRGRPLDYLPPATIRFNIRAARVRKFDCLPHSGMIPLIGERLASVLLRVCPHEVQLFPAVVCATDAKLTGYCLLNATREVAGVDYEESSFVPIPGTDAVMKFNRLRHRAEAFDGIHIAREHDYNSYLWVSTPLAEELLRTDCTGLHFIRPEEVHP